MRWRLKNISRTYSVPKKRISIRLPDGFVLNGHTWRYTNTLHLVLAATLLNIDDHIENTQTYAVNAYDYVSPMFLMLDTSLRMQKIEKLDG